MHPGRVLWLEPRRLKWLFFSAALFFLFSISFGFQFKSVSAASPFRTFYVSPTGNDANPGTENAPVRTLTKAADRVRTFSHVMTDDIVVYIRGGTYQLDQPWVLSPNDSGMNGHHIIYQNYPGETPVISGGREVTGWTQVGNIWRAPVGTGLAVRQLYVDGVRMLKARTNAPLPTYQKTARGYGLNVPDLRTWQNVSQIEFVSANRWKEFHCLVDRVEGQEIIMQQPCWKNAQLEIDPAMDTPTYIENALELLDQPGEWYYQATTGLLYYWPYAGQSISQVSAVIPVTEKLVAVAGTLDNPIHDIEFRGLRFEHATWLRPSTSEGYACVQASISYVGNPAHMEKTPAAVSFEAAHNIVLDRNVFTRLGGSGLSFDLGSQNNTITQNHFTDISATGLQIGDFSEANPQNPLKITKQNRITDNYFQSVAQEFQDGVAIWLGYVQSSVIEHNEMTNLPYTGISIGWGWGNSDPSVARDNHILSNYIHHHVQTLIDGGGIYSLSAQPGNVIAGNVITDQVNAGGAIYLDQGSRYIQVSDNVLMNNIRSALIKGGDHVILNNWWQEWHPGDVWFVEQAFGPNQIENNHPISSLAEAPASIVSSAGLEANASTIKYLPYPSNLLSQCSVEGSSVQLMWNRAQNAGTYTLALDQVQNNNSTAMDGWRVPGTTDTSEEVTNTSVTKPVECGQPYRWWLRTNAQPNQIPTKSFTCACTPQDTQAPTTPSALIINDVTAEVVKLGWQPSSDNVRVQRYEVFRNGIQISAVNSEHFSDFDVSPNTVYTYSIRAVDDAGNGSAVSAERSVQTPPAPSLPPASPAQVATPASPSVVPATPSALPLASTQPQKKVLGVDDALPVITEIRSPKGSFKFGQQVVRPFGSSYAGPIWARRISHRGQIWTILIPARRMINPQVLVYNQQGRRIASIPLPGHFFAIPQSTDIHYDQKIQKLFVVVTAPNRGDIQIILFSKGKLNKTQTLVIPPGLNSQTRVRFTSASQTEGRLAAIVGSDIKTLRSWIYHSSEKRFIQKSSENITPFLRKKMLIQLSKK